MKYRYIPLLIVVLSFISCKEQKEYDATGTFEAAEVIVSAESSGKLLYFNAEEGTVLQKNTEVGLVDTVQLFLKKLQLKASRKAVDTQRPDIQVQIAATREQIATAERERNRVQNLLKDNAATRKQLDDWNSQIALLKRQLAAQISSLQRNTASLNEQSSSVTIQVAALDDQLKKCHIYSPITGTVLARYAEPGELMAQGKPLFKIADLSRTYLRAYITSAQLSKVRLGTKVLVFADSGNQIHRKYDGTVTWISSQAEFTPKTILTDDERASQVYAVKISVKNDGMIKLGMYGEVKF